MDRDGQKTGIDTNIAVLYTVLCCRSVHCFQIVTLGWRRGVVVSGVRGMNEVNARRARLVLGWVTVFGWVYHLGV